MSAPYIPVPDLIGTLNTRDCFPAGISNEEIWNLINAAEQLIGRARQELLHRRTEAQWAEQKTRDD
jgi:hypothetical protein